MAEQGQNPMQQPEVPATQPQSGMLQNQQMAYPMQSSQPVQFDPQTGMPISMPQQQQWQYAQQSQSTMPQPPYQVPNQGSASYGQPAQMSHPVQAEPEAVEAEPKKKMNVMALIALIVGILAVLASPTVFGGITLGVVAIVLALLSRKEKLPGTGIAGFICGVLGVVLSMAMIVVCIVFLSTEIGEYTYNRVIGNFIDTIGFGAPLVDEAPGTVIADDEVCKITIKRLEFDEEGNLNVYFEATNRVVREIDITTKAGDPWLLNNEKVECICYSWVDPGQTKEDCFTIPKDYLSSNDIRSFNSLRGMLVVDLETGFDMEYEVRL